MAAKHKVTIDRQDCTICESCWTICPEFFEQSPIDSFSQVVAKYQIGGDPATGESPPELEDKVQEAAASCPVAIIHVE